MPAADLSPLDSTSTGRSKPTVHQKATAKRSEALLWRYAAHFVYKPIVTSSLAGGWQFTKQPTMATSYIQLNQQLAQFGFALGRSGVHQTRSMVLANLRQSLKYLPDIDVGRDDILAAILDQNNLGKRSVSYRFVIYRPTAPSGITSRQNCV